MENAGQCRKKQTVVPRRCRAVVAVGAAFPERVRRVATGHSLAATDCRALVGVGSSAGVRNGVRRIFRVPKRQALCHRADSSCVETSQREVVWKVSLLEKAFSERGQDLTVDLNDCVNEVQTRPS